MANKNDFFIFRNCYTGAVAGGDVHMDGVGDWISTNHKDAPITLIFSKDDGQDEVYPMANKAVTIQYRMPFKKLPVAIGYLIRAFMAAYLIRLPLKAERSILVASSHFLPDVLPAYIQARRNPHVKRVVYIHHIVQDMPRAKGFNTWLAKQQEDLCFSLIRKRFDKVVVVNQETLEALRKRGFSKQEFHVSSNFVDISMDSPVSFASKTYTVMFCGRMVSQKGVDDFLTVCEYLQPRVAGFGALMIGSGPELERIRKTIQSKGLRVDTPGFTSNEEKLQALRKSKLFLFPSIEEGWGIVIAESLAAGTPVLTYDLPVYKDIFSDKLHKVPLKDVESLSKLAGELLDSYQKSGASYTKEQKEIVDFASRYSRAQVASDQYNFLTA